MGMSDVSSKTQEHIANGNLISFRVMFLHASVPKLSYHVIRNVRDFSNNSYFFNIVNRRQENKFDHAFQICQT